MRLWGRWLLGVGCVLLVVPFAASVAVGAAAHGSAAVKAFAATQRNLIVNGSFESPAVSPGSYQLYTPGQRFRGWSVVGPAGSNMAMISGTFTQNGLRFDAHSGKQYVDLTGTSDLVNHNLAGVSQTVATAPGARYRLTFWVGNVVNPGGIFGTKSTVEVTVGGKRVLLAKTAVGAGATSQAWQQFHLSFKASTARTTLAFLNYDVASDTSNGLDSVALARD